MTTSGSMRTQPQATTRYESPRRAFVLACLALLVVCQLASVTAAEGAPTVTFKVKPQPIPGFPGTGNILGAGAQVTVQDTISGTEYGGFPSPLVLLAILAPAGTKINSTGFATCSPAALENVGPSACPKQSIAGPVGEGIGVVTFGGEQVREKVTLQSFFAPNNGLTVYANGSTPVSLQIVEKGHWITGPAPYGPELIVDIPLVESVPGAPDASILSFKVAVGAAYRKHGKMHSYITLPKHCPRGGAPIKTELGFLSGEHSTVAFKQPCPAR
ncbi:MAG: hypothetical protein WB709_00350 [Solirubrobacteraceae bacterium]